MSGQGIIIPRGWTGGRPAQNDNRRSSIFHTSPRRQREAFFPLSLLPTGENCLDSLVVASSLIHYTEALKLLFAVRLGFTLPALFARQFATIDYWSGGRALVNIVTGGSPTELASDGDFLDHDTCYRRTKEFIQVLKRFSWRNLLIMKENSIA